MRKIQRKFLWQTSNCVFKNRLEFVSHVMLYDSIDCKSLRMFSGGKKSEREREICIECYLSGLQH